MYYVYILKSMEHDRLYEGSTSNLKNRLKQHNNGQVSFKRPFMPWELIYYEAFKSKTDALNEEKFLKSGKGRERIKYLFS